MNYEKSWLPLYTSQFLIQGRHRKDINLDGRSLPPKQILFFVKCGLAAKMRKKHDVLNPRILCFFRLIAS